MWIRKLAMVTSLLFIMLVMGLMLTSTTVIAQGGGRRTPDGSGDRPGGGTGGGGTGGQRPTVSSPQVEVTPPSFSTPDVTIPERGDLPSIEDITLPTDLPTWDELETIEFDFEFSLEGVDTSGLPTSSEAAYTAIVGFASSNFGTSVQPLYAGDLTSDTTLPGGYDDLIAQVWAQFPDDVQALLNSASDISGSGYWGVFANGAGVVYAADCAGNPACTVGIDSMSVQIGENALGAYGLYTDFATPTTEYDAMWAVQTVYPALTAYNLTSVAVEEGYAFTATAMNMTDRTAAVITVVYAGLVDAGGHPLVYAVLAIGEGYVTVMPG